MRLIVNVSKQHTTGVRYRAGIRFERTPIEVEVDEASALAIMGDGFLEVEDVPKPIEDVPVADDDVQLKASDAQAPDRDTLKAALTEKGIEFKKNTPTKKLIELLEGAE